MNLISEVATPFSMAFRHYGNILSGSIVAVLMGTLLQNLSARFLGWLPGFLGDIPFLQIGIPALLSVYFDLFGACLQAYIFAVLTMLYVSNGFPKAAFEQRRRRRLEKKMKL
jgi:F-type H+-transporting ATPase subunit a